MPDIDQLDQLLEEQFGFKDVAQAEVQRVEASIRKDVIEPALKRLKEQQDALERARTWYVA